MEKKTATPTSTEFGEHPSKKLQEAFKGFQIQKPEEAKIIFLGLDANWDKDIEDNKPFFDDTIRYLENGIEYWKNNWKDYKVHTPMLKDFYRGGNGRRYHEKFQRLEFSPDDAKDICFLELLNVCTFGNKSKNTKEYERLLTRPENTKHLEKIREIFELENFICIADGVKTEIDRLNNKLKLGLNLERKNIKPHTHFSDAISNKELEEIRIELWAYLGKK